MAEGGEPSLQVGPVNIDIRQEGDVDVEPQVEVSRLTRDQDYMDSYEEVTGDFSNIQLGNGSNIMVNSLRLESKDIILKIQWSNWDIKKEGILSRIKLEIRTALEEEKDKFEKYVIKWLLSQYRHGVFVALTNIIDAIFQRFNARLYQITGGCIELWVSHESYEELELMRTKQDEIEFLLTDELCHLFDDKTRKGSYWYSVSFLDVSSEELYMAEPELFPARYVTRKEPAPKRTLLQSFIHQTEMPGSNEREEIDGDLQKKFDKEHQLRTAAEKSLDASKRINEELTLKIEELQRQLQKEKTIIEALEKQYGLSASASNVSESVTACPGDDISDMEVVSSSTVVVRLKDDGTEPAITGCVYLSSGQLVLCDCDNNKVKLLSSTLTVEDSLDLQGRAPWDVSALSGSTVVVTLPWEHQLQYIQLAPKLQLGRVIQLDKVCRCVCVAANEIYVTCFSDEGNDGEVRIITIDGKVKRSIGGPIKPQSSYVFSPPLYLTVSACTGRIFVADYDCSTLTCLSVDGSIIYRYSDPNLEYSNGVYVDAADNVIVCGRASRNVQIISPKGKHIRTLLTGIRDPYSVAYRPTDSTVVVGCLEDDNLHVFKLSH